MSQKFLFVVSCLGILNFHLGENKLTGWTSFVTSKNYANNKLVLEASNPFAAQYFNKDKYRELTARMACSKICAGKSQCLSFNLFRIATHYVCEPLNDNFCARRERLALQASPGGQVWDKLTPGAPSACIDQKFTSNISSNYCEIGRSGCRSVWPNCDICVQSCNNCSVLYNKTGSYSCTMWPEGPFGRPIFGFCDGKATFLARRRIYFTSPGGYAYPDYRMPSEDMNRLYQVGVYNILMFVFKSTTGETYTATYENFAIDPLGTLSNMTYKIGSGTDGFKTGATPLAPAPFTWNQWSMKYNCGPFWLLSSTHGSAANQYCPGGGVNMFGGVINFLNMQDTGIKWPQATSDGKLLSYTEMKMGI